MRGKILNFVLKSYSVYYIINIIAFYTRNIIKTIFKKNKINVFSQKERFYNTLTEEVKCQRKKFLTLDESMFLTYLKKQANKSLQK